jgi:hypothetical protein
MRMRLEQLENRFARAGQAPRLDPQPFRQIPEFGSPRGMRMIMTVPMPVPVPV